MLIDLTMQITPEMAAKGNEKQELAGHLGTHFDVMDKEFPLEYTRRRAVVFDVSAVEDRDIGVVDVDLSRVERDMFVAFHTGFSEREPYGTRTYFATHPQLTDELIDALLERGVSLIGVDFGGVRRGSEHTPKDQYCADRGVFIIENLVNLKAAENARVIHTYPLKCTGITGLPCRVVGEV